MNPYAPPPTTNLRKCSLALQRLTFAAAATVAFVLASLMSHWLRSDARPFVDSLIQFATSFLPFFAFSAVVASFNLCSLNASGHIYSTFTIRLIGGMTLGFAPIPVNYIIVDYLWFIDSGFPHKVAEITLVVLIPVIVCTIVERSILKFVDCNVDLALSLNTPISDGG